MPAARAGVLNGLAVACAWLAVVISGLSLGGMAVALLQPRQLAPGFGALDALLGWIVVAGVLTLATMAFRRLASRA